jgi:alpha-mannosidase
MHDKLLKVAFPTTIRNRNARYGIQFGHIQRPAHNNSIRDMAKFEVYGRWAELGEESRGVALMSESKGGYDVHDGIMRMSLLKSSMNPDRWQDFGVRKFIYRGVFHNSGWNDAHIPLIHDELIYSPLTVEVNPESKGRLPQSTEFVSVDDDWVVLDTLKVAEEHDGFIARFYEAGGSLRRVKVVFPLLESKDWKNPIVVSFLEDQFGNECVEKIEATALSFFITVKPFEVLSLKIARA